VSFVSTAAVGAVGVPVKAAFAAVA